ncbi:amino acid adenylation domain-containing protein [Acinetobacter baumannii]|nr:amino acid adenylation domain-containing protein [Acinetobacter baumannii]
MNNLARLEPEVLSRHAISAEQLGIWYIQRLEPTCSAYNMVVAFDVKVNQSLGNKPIEILEAVMHDYPLLRVSMPANDQGIEQLIWDRVYPNIIFSDARHIEASDLTQLVEQDTKQPFDLTQPPLWRIHCYERGQNHYVIAFVIHHALMDFWSIGLLLRDVSKRFGLVAESDAVNGIEFAQYADKQQSSVIDDTDESLIFWKNALKHAPHVHSIPLDYPRPAVQHHKGSSLVFRVPESVSSGLVNLAKNYEITLFGLVLSGFYILLHKLSNENNLVIATPVAGRLERSLRNALGQFVNTIAIYMDIDADQTLRQFTQQVQEQLRQSLKHQKVAFSRVVEAVSPKRDGSINPLAQIGMFWERLGGMDEFKELLLPIQTPATLVGQDLTLGSFPVRQQEGQLDITLEMGGEYQGELVGVLKYNTDLFSAQSAENMVQLLQAVLAEMVAHPERKIVELDIAPDYKDGIQFEALRGKVTDYAQHDLLGMILKQIEERGENHALTSNDHTISYRDLGQYIAGIAEYLRAHGITRGDRVGLMLDRTALLPAAILGIWAAGAAYVPLDPNFPTERLQNIIEDAEPKVILTQTELRDALNVTVPRLDINQAGVVALEQVRETLAFGDIAYVMYTSGSTGKPKGVRIGHPSIINFLLSMNDRLQVTTETQLLAITTYAFDISILELLIPLMYGGVVHVCPREVSQDGNQLVDYLNAKSINILQATPASWKMLLDSEWSGNAGLTALCGGEALDTILAEKLLGKVGCLWNVYGPTETTVWSSAARITDAKYIDLGEPLANTQLYVLDEKQRLVPPGVMGELWIGGDGLAVDYWHRPELTDAQFRTLPSLPNAGRLYRTGDKVCLRTDGRLTHHGRLDFQVKIRGFRIELGEIENVLKQIDGITDAVVLVKTTADNDQKLVAYVTGQELDIAGLKKTLQIHLPAYMVPSAFIRLDEFPMTANNKLDRKAFPEPIFEQSNDYVAPRDPIEIELCTTFEQILSVKRVGIHDDFFELGGHSLLAVKLVNHLKKAFGTELSVALLAQYSTVERLGEIIRENKEIKPSIVIELRRGTYEQPLWLFHPIGGSTFCYMELSRHLNPNRTLRAIQSPGLIEADAAEVAIEEMATLYIAEMRKMQPQGPYFLGGWCFGGAIAYEISRQLRQMGQQVTGIVMIDTRAPIPENVPEDADDAMLLSWFARDLAAPYGKKLTIPAQYLRELSPDQMFDHVLKEAKAINVLPLDADPSDFRLYFDTYLANGIALQTYFPEPEDFPILLVKAKDEPEDFGESLGWDQLVKDTLTQVDLPGDHSSIMYAENVVAVAQTIDQMYPIPA